MDWSADPELRQMFLDELDQRAGWLTQAARALAAGDGESVDASAMRREGHTIKGTARVMGYDVAGGVGLMLEEVWGGIDAGDVAPSAGLGQALARLSAELQVAGREDPRAGTPGLYEAVRAVHDIVPGLSAVAFPDVVPGDLPRPGTGTTLELPR